MNASIIKRFEIVFRGLRDRDVASRALTQIRCERDAKIVLKLRSIECIARAIRNLDERWDGKGWPDGLRGHGIPRLSQIALVAHVCDVFHTNYSSDLARDETVGRTGTWFNPEVIDAIDVAASDPAF